MPQVTPAELASVLKSVPAMVRKYGRLVPRYSSWEEACQEASLAVVQAARSFESKSLRSPVRFATWADRCARYAIWAWVRRAKRVELGAAAPLAEAGVERAIHGSSYIDRPATPEQHLLAQEELRAANLRAARFVSKLSGAARAQATVVLGAKPKALPKGTRMADALRAPTTHARHKAARTYEQVCARRVIERAAAKALAR